jgi:hypothetical protein
MDAGEMDTGEEHNDDDVVARLFNRFTDGEEVSKASPS